MDIWNGYLTVKELPNITSLNPNDIPSPYLCCPYIPTHMHVIEFCEFLEPFQTKLSKMRVLRAAENSFYIIVIKMNTSNLIFFTFKVIDTLEFLKHYQRRKFNLIESDLCQVNLLLQATFRSEKEDPENKPCFQSPAILFETEKD